jgi:iron complex transport system substrate-binding protein
MVLTLINVGENAAEEGTGGRSGSKASKSSWPGRVISMAPNITETIFLLGEGDRLVGVTSFCVYPLQAKALPKVGGFYNPNLERLIALRPDLVALQGMHRKVDAFCRTRNIPVCHVDMDSLSTIYGGIMKLGSVLGVSARAKIQCENIRNGLERVRRKTAGMGRKRIYISLGRTMGSMSNLYTVGGTSFISEVLSVAGGTNVFADVTQPYPEVSKESLIKRAPDIILEIYPGETISERQRRQILEEWKAFPTIPAVDEGEIHIMTEDFILLPGPRVVRVAEIFADAIHGGTNGQ